MSDTKDASLWTNPVWTGPPCRLGYQEYDGARYCFEHAGFLAAGLRSSVCDRHPGFERGDRS